MLALLMFLAVAHPVEPPQPQWAFELTIRAAGHEWTMRMPVDEYLTCEEMRDTWLTEGPRDTEEFSSDSDCVDVSASLGPRS